MLSESFAFAFAMSFDADDDEDGVVGWLVVFMPSNMEVRGLGFEGALSVA